MPVDIENLESLKFFLRELGKIGPNEKCNLQILGGGVSNKTILLIRENGEKWVVKQALTKLRVADDWYCTPERLHTEYKAINWLSGFLPAHGVPKPVFFNGSNHILAMKAVPQPHDNLKTLFLQGVIKMKLVGDLANILGMIHTAGKESTEAKRLFNDRSFFESLRLEAYYKCTSEQLPTSKYFFRNLIGETLRIQETVVHGDFSPKNILVRDEKLVLLDHEVMHYGDPAFDVGFCLSHFLSKANHLEEFRGKFLEAACLFWKKYSDVYKGMDKQREERVIQHSLGCFLSRIMGRSPLEYLDKKSGERQMRIGMKLIDQNISSFPELIKNFKSELKAK